MADAGPYRCSCSERRLGFAFTHRDGRCNEERGPKRKLGKFLQLFAQRGLERIVARSEAEEGMRRFCFTGHSVESQDEETHRVAETRERCICTSRQAGSSLRMGANQDRSSVTLL